jgi:hypothetical protein
VVVNRVLMSVFHTISRQFLLFSHEILACGRVCSHQAIGRHQAIARGAYTVEHVEGNGGPS